MESAVELLDDIVRDLADLSCVDSKDEILERVYEVRRKIREYKKTSET